MIRSVTFFSNYFNHHQRALCDELYAALSEGFCFVETEPMEEFRSRMGWQVDDIPPYVLKSHESPEAKARAYELALSSDVVIMGTAPEDFIRQRLKEDKLTFRYSERPLKEGRWKIFVPYLAKKLYVNHISNRQKPLYCLCAGAFVASDYRFLMNSYKDKCYKFGYFPFPEIRSIDEIMDAREKRDRIKILWCGRFIKLKRADLVIKACRILADKGYDFDLELVGNGEEEEHLKELCDSLKLSDRTQFTGYMSPSEVRRKMEEADIYVCTSNKLEGWGSVIYEGLSAGCATVATSVAGATPFLIEDGTTGYVFRSGSEKSLAHKLELCLKDKEHMKDIGRAAYRQMADHWNPREAAARLIEVSGHLIKGESCFMDVGPMSKAGILYEDWYRE